MRRRIVREEAGGDLVHQQIGALGTQHGGGEQFEWGGEVQLAEDVGVLVIQGPDDSRDPLVRRYRIVHRPRLF